MDQRRYWRRTGHRVGEPGVQRDLRALPGATEEEEETNPGDHRRPQGAELRANALELERPQVRVEHEHRDQKADVADAVHDERLLPRVSVRRIEIPETDQEIRAQADTLPTDEHDGITGSHHKNQHESDEQIEVREIARIPWIVPHVTDAKDVDQHSHAGDDQDHHHRQLIELECGVDVEITDGHPLEVALDERGMSLGASALHREEDDGGEREREHHDAGPNYTR